jgi:hypothetical protein
MKLANGFIVPGSNQTITVKPTGLLGLNQGSPTAQLHINATSGRTTVQITTPNDGSAGLRVFSADGSTVNLDVTNGYTTIGGTLLTINTPYMQIGTSTQLGVLNIGNNSSNTEPTIVLVRTSGNTQPLFIFRDSGTAKQIAYWDVNANLILGNSVATSGSYGLQIIGGGLSITALLPASNGAVGYGGTQGTTVYYYWAAGQDRIGNRTLPVFLTSATTANATLSGSNYVVVPFIPGAGTSVTYILRTTTNVAPTGTGSYLCSAGTYNSLVITAATINDVSNTLSSFTVPARNTTADLIVQGQAQIADGSQILLLNASNLASGTIPTARYGLGTANNGSFLRGDQIWAIGAIAGEQVCGRLTLTSGTPCTPLDVVSVSTIYYTPYVGDTIPLYNSATSYWEILRFTELSINVSALGSNMYDIWATNSNVGSFTLTATAWTNTTTRNATYAPVYLNGVLVQNSVPNSRYLGSVYVYTGLTNDTQQNRWLWNNYNRIYRKLAYSDPSSATYTLTATTGTWQYCRNSSTTCYLFYVVGLQIEYVDLTITNYAQLPANTYFGTGMNISASSPTTTATIDQGIRFGGNSSILQVGAFARRMLMPALGVSLVTALEYAENGTVTFIPGVGTNSYFRPAIIGAMFA